MSFLDKFSYKTNCEQVVEPLRTEFAKAKNDYDERFTQVEEKLGDLKGEVDGLGSRVGGIANEQSGIAATVGEIGQALGWSGSGNAGDAVEELLNRQRAKLKQEVEAAVERISQDMKQYSIDITSSQGHVSAAKRAVEEFKEKLGQELSRLEKFENDQKKRLEDFGDFIRAKLKSLEEDLEKEIKDGMSRVEQSGGSFETSIRGKAEELGLLHEKIKKELDARDFNRTFKGRLRWLLFGV